MRIELTHPTSDSARRTELRVTCEAGRIEPTIKVRDIDADTVEIVIRTDENTSSPAVLVLRLPRRDADMLQVGLIENWGGGPD